MIAISLVMGIADNGHIEREGQDDIQPLHVIGTEHRGYVMHWYLGSEDTATATSFSSRCYVEHLREGLIFAVQIKDEGTMHQSCIDSFIVNV